MSTSIPVFLGGTAVRPEGPPTWPIPDPQIQEALEAAYREGAWGRYDGPHQERLTHALREYHQIEHALLCASGTYAVELALRALKVGEGDEAILAGYDFPGNFLDVHAVGAQPVLVDVDPGNWHLAVEGVAGAIGPKTRALIASHLHGGVVPMRRLMDLARERHIAVIEDAAQMPGAMIQGRRAGTWGDVGILSFGGSKLLCAGRGGALLTARDDIFQRAKTLAFRGNLVAPLSELQAAVLLPQLSKLDERNQQRLAGVHALGRLLEDVPGLRLFENPPGDDSQPGYYKVGFRYDAGKFGLAREVFVKALRAEGIAMDEGFPALHVGRSPRRYRRGTDLDESVQAHHGVVKLHHPVLLGSAEDLAQVAQAIRKVHAHAARLAELTPNT